MLLFSLFKISGHSMEPTIRNGSIVLVSIIPYVFSKPKAKDIISFREKASEKIMIKRIVKINKEKCFVRGDNENDSLDSKNFGVIDRRDILGKVLVIL